ncbi:hypothetical protein [Acinetobacter sp. ANC 4973]|uniref:hypothetical protein n=1 Tax=Acinetobacter sp. ANC 4973 TaxID=1977871 RepID=UPI000A33EA85|nr:hypothetical protein [Acinetobacter sp. ANC 4973]OTG99517.1 hypothetical protein B9T30_08480 [Acinetobacter sp. ANC 4973]
MKINIEVQHERLKQNIAVYFYVDWCGIDPNSGWRVKYSSYSNELIDQYEKSQKLFNKTKDRLQPSIKVDNYAETMKKVWIPFCNSVKNSVKFKLTEGNFLLSEGDNSFEFLGRFVEEISLPYESIVFEVDSFISGAAQNSPMLILLKQIDDSIYMQVAFKNDEWAGDWVIIETENEPVQLVFNRKKIHLALSMNTNNPDLDDLQIEKIKNLYHSCVFGTFVSFICALSCKNTKIEDSPIKQSSVKNSLRKSKGKLPFFTHKILTIDGSSTSTRGSNSGSHSAPRVHLRRGHIRRLPNKNVWVNSCVVGDKSKGMVSKDYAVKNTVGTKLNKGVEA